jgi:hypothetical protein
MVDGGMEYWNNGNKLRWIALSFMKPIIDELVKRLNLSP